MNHDDDRNAIIPAICYKRGSVCGEAMSGWLRDAHSTCSCSRPSPLVAEIKTSPHANCIVLPFIR